jgi:hypothetical protein
MEEANTAARILRTDWPKLESLIKTLRLIPLN